MPVLVSWCTELQGLTALLYREWSSKRCTGGPSDSWWPSQGSIVRDKEKEKFADSGEQEVSASDWAKTEASGWPTLLASEKHREGSIVLFLEQGLQ